MAIDEVKLLEEVNHIASNIPHSSSKRKSYLTEWIKRQAKISFDFHSCINEPPTDERPVLIYAEGYNANEQRYFVGYYQKGNWYTHDGRKFLKYPAGNHFRAIDWQDLPTRKY